MAPFHKELDRVKIEMSLADLTRGHFKAKEDYRKSWAKAISRLGYTLFLESERSVRKNIPILIASNFVQSLGLAK